MDDHSALNAPPELHERLAGDFIKIWFRFDPREDWFPFDTEGLWATMISADTARLKNIPFLQNGYAEGDIVRFDTDADGRHWGQECVEASGNCTIRILPNPNGPFGRSGRAIHDRFIIYSMGSEIYSDAVPFVAFNVPADADFAEIKEILSMGEEQDWWYVDIGCTTERWVEA